MKKISVVIITKNEEKNISNCLNHLLWADEVIIIDDFSTDKTKEFALKYKNVKFYEKKFENFASFRNLGLNLAKNNWILSIDPDEEVSSELKNEITELLKNKNDNICAYYIPTKEIFYGKHLKFGGWYPDYHVRLFIKNKSAWVNPVHEAVKVDGDIGYISNPIVHFGHKTIFETIEKINKYTTIESIEKFEKGIKTNYFKAIFAFLYEFINRYIIKQGFKDGFYGLVVSVFMGMYKFTVEAKLYEKYNKKYHRLE